MNQRIVLFATVLGLSVPGLAAPHYNAIDKVLTLEGADLKDIAERGFRSHEWTFEVGGHTFEFEPEAPFGALSFWTHSTIGTVDTFYCEAYVVGEGPTGNGWSVLAEATLPYDFTYYSVDTRKITTTPAHKMFDISLRIKEVVPSAVIDSKAPAPSPGALAGDAAPNSLTSLSSTRVSGSSISSPIASAPLPAGDERKALGLLKELLMDDLRGVNTHLLFD